MRLDVEPGEDDDEQPPWYQEHLQTPTWPVADSPRSPPDSQLIVLHTDPPILRDFQAGPTCSLRRGRINS
ncbi:hypothetical protein FQN50_009350 [Emmonsiellopsis sp. PD_5]|nr:hypothetical protein FQN50_009350 [Emmonsiellopsis sp. PD_5]